MARQTVVKVEGLRELGEAMRSLKEDVQKKISRTATNAAAQVIKRAAVKNAPVDTGNLRKNIIVKRLTGKDSDLTSEHIVTIRQQRTKKARKAGERAAFYGMFLEFGTVKMAAKPFLRPAYESEKDAAQKAMVDRLEKRIEKARKTKP